MKEEQGRASEGPVPLDLDGTPRFPEYGLGGDYAGARRTRRAFRFMVLACLFFTFVLWTSERYLRYDLNETQYRMALTLPDDSARAILRNVVKRDSEQSEVPTAKYVEALASIEEDDLVLPRYEEAYRLNPNNASLIINYGCRLFHAGQYKEARERFREASLQPPKNALPRYLEAAALVATPAGQEDLSEAIALVARTNGSGDPVLFPKPLWHPSLKRAGARHSALRQRVVSRCCAPLYRFRHDVLGKASADIEARQLGNWASWLEAIEAMGGRLVGDARAEEEHLGVDQAIAGVQLQAEAVDLRKRIGQIMYGAPSTALVERGLRLAQSLEVLKGFQDIRDARGQEEQAVIRRPMSLCGTTLAVLLAAYAVSVLLYRLTHTRRTSWTLAHTRFCKAVLLSGLALQVVLLLLLAHLATAGPEGAPWLERGVLVWQVLLGFLVAFGLVYPFMALPTAQQVCERAPANGDPERLYSAAQRSRRMAAVSLMRRYYGLLAGGFLCVLCLWGMAYRIAEGLYPNQYALILNGFEREEIEAIREVQALLAGNEEEATSGVEAWNAGFGAGGDVSGYKGP